MTLSVSNTPELRRIVALPRRRLADAGAAVRFWTAALRTPHGQQTLTPLQAQALEDAWTTGRGLYISAPVGAGKTLLAWLLLTLFEAERGVIVAPSGMLKEMHALHQSYRDHWLAPPRPPRLLGFEELDRAAESPLLELQPDVLAIDEAHRTRRRTRIATKVIDRYRRVAGAELRFMATMTGTPGRQSIFDISHHLVWCLGDGAPVPRSYPEQRQWAGALDLKGRDHCGVGVLRTLGGEGPTLKARARDWFRQRLADTPGVILDAQDSCAKALRIIQITPPADAKIEADFKRFRTEFETPGGQIVSDPLCGFRLETELSLGYHGVWDPPPPVEWLRARKRFADFTRKKIADSQHSRKPLDSEMRVAKAYPEAAPVLEWQAIRDTYKIEPKAVWRSPSVVQFVAQWLKANGPALAYVWSVPLCQALQKVSGLAWYGRKGIDAMTGRYIGDAPGAASAIVSGSANIEGRNLQAWNRAIYVAPPQAANWLEQALGRLHRQGQTSDVEVYMLVASAGGAAGFETALTEADFGREIFGSDQKIRRAEILRSKLPPNTYRYC